MISSQPGCLSSSNQGPSQLHGGGGLGPTVDDITAKHDVIILWQSAEQSLQRLVTTMHVTDHPVIARE
jgi:molybdopterin-biosynthesis enzyme MoeA-like protein